MGGSGAHGERLFTSGFVLLTLSEVCYFVAAGVIIQVLPQYVVGPVESDAAGAGIAFGAFTVTALLGRPLAGRLVDTRGRMPLMVFGAVVAGAGALVLPLTESLPVIVAARLGQGVGEAAFFVAAFAALADVAPPARLGEALSINSLGLYLGLSLGPPLGQLLLDWRGYVTAMAGSAVFCALASLAALAMGEPGREAVIRDTGGPRALIHRPAVPILIGFFTSMFAIGGFLTFAALHARALGLANPSLPLFVYGAVVVVCRIAFATLPDRLPKLPLGALSLAAIALGFAVVALWQAPVGLVLGVVIFALGVTFSTPAFFGAALETAAPHQRGVAAGTITMSIDLGLGLGPVALGLVAREAGIPAGFAVAGALALAGALWTAALARRTGQWGVFGASR